MRLHPWTTRGPLISALLCVISAGCASGPSTAVTQPTSVPITSQQAQANALAAYERSRDAAQYQAALSRQRVGDLKASRQTLEQLLARNPQHLAGQRLLAELDTVQGTSEPSPFGPGQGEGPFDTSLALAPADARTEWASTPRQPSQQAASSAPLAVLASDETGTGVINCSFDQTDSSSRTSLRFRPSTSEPSSPTSVQPLVQPAIAAIAAGQPEQAVQSLLPIVSEFPDDPAVHRTIGLAYYRLGRFSAAEASLRQALSLDNLNPLSYFLLGCTMTRLGDTEAAKPLLERASQLDPKYGRAAAGNRREANLR